MAIDPVPRAASFGMKSIVDLITSNRIHTRITADAITESWFSLLTLFLILPR